MRRTANAEYVGQDPGNPPNGQSQNQTPQPAASVDLAPVYFGAETFRNPCFWLLVGAVGALAVEHFLIKPRRTT